MNAKPRLSVFIITYNEEKNIERCLRSIAWADEIIVVDSFSEDQTVEISKKYSAKVFLRDFTDYADQKNFALSQTTREWALSLDADEEVTEELKDEIMATIQSPAALAGYRIPHHPFIFKRKFFFSGTQDAKPMRLFRKSAARYAQPIHEKVIIQGETGTLKRPFLHYTYETIGDYFQKFNRYTSMEAQLLKDKNHKLRLWDFSLKPFLLFLKLFLLKQGFRDGLEGFLFCAFSGGYVFVKYAKYRELLGVTDSTTPSRFSPLPKGEGNRADRTDHEILSGASRSVDHAS
ncbi:MAG TPA: glycosyltransferase family 2 protein [bacterium]|nr:glycosyltransferase family 2 protein [bacterium]